MAKHSYTKEQSIAFNNAIYRKNTKDVKDFLDKYPSLIFTRWGLDEKASLHYAAQVGCGGIINDLLVAGAEVNVTTYLE